MVMTEGGFMVSGPGPEVGSTDAAVAVMDGTRGVKIRGSLVTIDADGSVDIPSGEAYGIDGTPLAYGDVGAAAADHEHAAGDITSGSLDGDLLPALSTGKRGGVAATGTPSGLFLRDDDSWAAGGGAYRRPATIVVAASDSLDVTNVDFVCPATDALDYITTTVIPALPAGGGKILFMDGTYTMTTADKGIVLDRDNVVFEGMGKGTLIQTNGALVGEIFDLVDWDYIQIRNLRIKGNRGAVNYGIWVGGGSYNGGGHIFENVTIQDCYYGCQWEARSSGKFRVCHFNDNLYSFFTLYMSGADFNGCSSDGNNSYGWYMHVNGQGVGNNLVNCGFASYQVGVFTQCNIVNCRFGATGGVTEIGAELHFCIASNSFFAASRDGLTLDDSNIVSNCAFSSYNGLRSPGTYSHIKTANGYGNNIIENNLFGVHGGGPFNGYNISVVSGSFNNVIRGNKTVSGGEPTVQEILDAGTQTIYGSPMRTLLPNVAAEDPDAIVDNEDLNVSLPLTCTLDGQPDYGRNVTLALTDVDDSISAINITVKGITSQGKVVTETFTFASFTAKVATGNYPFETITEVKVNSATGIGAGDLLDVGTGKKLGLSGRLVVTGDVVWVKQNGTKTSSFTTNAIYGTIAPTTLTAADDFDILWIKNTDIWTV
jgi:hypothetical protein